MLDMSRPFLPEALAGLEPVGVLSPQDRRLLNQIRGMSYLHLFDLLESSLVDVVHERARLDVEVRDALAPLLTFDCFDHHELFATFEAELGRALPVPVGLVPRPDDLRETLMLAAPLSLLILALHFKLVTQQHYLACVRGDESLEPHFVRLLKTHWNVECGAARARLSSLAIQEGLAHALPGRIPSALRDYRLLVFACDDVLRRQAVLDVVTLEAARHEPLGRAIQPIVTGSQVRAMRKTFLTTGIANTAFVYAMRTLGPTAPAMLAGVVSALTSRV
jgi:hypothetical protein